MLKGENLIFLISQPRAGSTLLQRLLQNHSMIHSLAEPWIMLHPLYNLKEKGFKAEYNSTCAYVAVKNFFNHFPQKEDCYYEGLRRMYGYIYRQVLKSSNKVFFLDKTPRYYHVIPELAYTFPQARFIILLRNPLAVLFSILNTWVKNDLPDLKNYEHDILHAPNLIANGIASLELKKLTIASYEEILNSPENELTRIFSSMNIPFEREVLKLRQTNPAGYGYQDQTAENLSNNINLRNINSWKDALKNPQYWRLASDYLSVLEDKTLETLGYSHKSLKKELNDNHPGRIALLKTYSMKYLLENEIASRNKTMMFAKLLRDNLKAMLSSSRSW